MRVSCGGPSGQELGPGGRALGSSSREVRRSGQASRSTSSGGGGPRIESDLDSQRADQEPNAAQIDREPNAAQADRDLAAQGSAGFPVFSMGRHFMYARGKPHIPVGAHVVPSSGPDWPWREGPEAFDRAFAQMAERGLTSARIDLLWAAVEPERGRLNEAHLDVLDRIFDAAKTHGITLHPALFVGGEVGDAYWDLPWASGLNPHSDPDLLHLQATHAACLARRWAGRAELIAWDLTDEPPFWIHGESTDDEHAVAWTAALTDAIRTNDPGRPITIGTASQEVDGGPFRADVVAGALDFTCVHPYPIYSPELYADRLRSRRMSMAGAFETALARGAGKPVMVHEFGASSTQFAPEAVADYDRLVCWSSFGAGAIGFYAWCWIDAEPAAYRRAPYVRMPHETQFGLLDAEGKARPRARVLSELSRVTQALDLEGLAGNGPWTPASIPVPHEYVKPYDRASYGLDDAPAGPYVPAEKAWEPERDVKPLVRGWLNSYVFASRAGLPCQFPREKLDDSWPATPITLLPAPLTSTTSSLLHMRTSFWQGALDYVEAGGIVYLSCSADTAVPELAEFAGVRIADRALATDRLELTAVEPFAGLEAGDVVSVELPAAVKAGGAANNLHLRGVELDVIDAKAVATDAAGLPAVTVARRGRGAVIVCAYPIELLAAEIPDAHGDADGLWRVYRLVREVAGVEPPVELDSPQLTRGVLRGPRGGILVATNHGREDVSVPVKISGSVKTVESVTAIGVRAEAGGNVLIGSNNAVSNGVAGGNGTADNSAVDSNVAGNSNATGGAVLRSGRRIESGEVVYVPAGEAAIISWGASVHS